MQILHSVHTAFIWSRGIKYMVHAGRSYSPGVFLKGFVAVAVRALPGAVLINWGS